MSNFGENKGIKKVFLLQEEAYLGDFSLDLPMLLRFLMLTQKNPNGKDFSEKVLNTSIHNLNNLLRGNVSKLNRKHLEALESNLPKEMFSLAREFKESSKLVDIVLFKKL